MLILITVFCTSCNNKQKAELRSEPANSASKLSKDTGLQLMGNRFFTFNTVVRVRQIETSRDEAEGPDESSIHTPEEARTFRRTIEKGWPGARITWAFSWLALKDERPYYMDLKKMTWEPEFYTYVRDAFAPVGLMIDACADSYPAGKLKEFPVRVINDLDKDWKGEVRFRLLMEGGIIQEKTQSCEVSALGVSKIAFVIPILVKPGNYRV